MFNIDGLVSGIDTTSIIESLLSFQQRQVDQLEVRKSEITTKQTSLAGVEAQLVTLNSSLFALNRTTNSVFDARLASSSDTDIIEATADSGAIEARYQLSVQQTATAEQLASQGFANTGDTIGTGDIAIRVGSRPEQTVTISTTNNTLEGFVNAVNEQLDDVNASIIFDQGAGAYKVLMTSRHTGADNTIAITNSQDPLTGTVISFAGTPVQSAENAVIQLGSGAGAILAEYDSNIIDGLIENVTLDLKSADPGTVVTIGVENDNESVVNAVTTFTQNFNGLMEFIDQQTAYNPETDEASPLLGERAVTTLQTELLTTVTSTISGSTVTRLSQVGIDINLQGRLTFNSSTLEDALNGDIQGIDPEDVRKLFGVAGDSTNPGIKYLGGSTRTQATGTAFDIDITQAAEQAVATATNALVGPITIDNTSDQIQLSLNGVTSETLTLNSGTYTEAELAAEVENVINNSSELGANDVTVSVDGTNRLVIRTIGYGNDASIASISGTALAKLGLDGTETGTGQDVEGSFIVDGVTEEAAGLGRSLVGDSENETTADLRLNVSLSSSQVVAGVDGQLTLTQGLTSRLREILDGALNSETGVLKFENDALDDQIASIDASIERTLEITEIRRQSLLDEFSALESVIAELQNTGSFVTSQLSALNASARNANNNNNG
ncbi:Flagellar hook-associated protein 2 [Stieleria bergensis]|uniref:Flagellar hook-associated protein 2 n=1 Tax=Stieleria bergensis TaxID=2528025 RepID=A0A517SUB7_9BACT|nr:Flagellar hook-associated protein 2 [Planctomycetes bacterium SV_7m_r]